jgi:tRNA U34 5-carboxymethylaminomethyl modifying enzyme MnmG/GidA
MIIVVFVLKVPASSEGFLLPQIWGSKSFIGNEFAIVARIAITTTQSVQDAEQISKGARVQSDRMRFAEEWRMLEGTPNLDFYQEMVKGLIIENGKVKECLTWIGDTI